MIEIREVMDDVIAELTTKHFKLKPLTPQQDNIYAAQTLDAYLKFIRIISDNKFIRLKLPDYDTKLYEKLVLFAKIAELKKMEVGAMMDIAFKAYSQSWCNETFHRPYPPLNILLGQKNMLRIVRGF